MQDHNSKQLPNWCLHLIAKNYAFFKSRQEFSRLTGDDLLFVEEHQWPPISYLQELAEYEAECARAHVKARRKCIIMWYEIDPSHKSRNVSKHPTMHHFVTEMCTHVHISVTKWCIVGCGWDRRIVGFVRLVYLSCSFICTDIFAGSLVAHKRLVISRQYWNKNCSSHDLLLSCQGIIPLEVNHITVTSHERHDVSNHQQLDCLFNRSFKLTTIDPSKSYILGPLRGDHRCPVGSPHRGSVMREAFLWHGVTLSLEYNHSY